MEKDWRAQPAPWSRAPSPASVGGGGSAAAAAVPKPVLAAPAINPWRVAGIAMRTSPAASATAASAASASGGSASEERWEVAVSKRPPPHGTKTGGGFRKCGGGKDRR